MFILNGSPRTSTPTDLCDILKSESQNVMRRVGSFTIIAFNYIQNSAGIPFPPVKVFGI